MKNLCKTIIFLLFIFSLASYGQNQELKLTELSDKEYSKLLNNQFSQIVTGQNNNSLGNFASVDFVESTVEFAPSIFFSNGNIIVAEIKAGISDGTSSIFSNSKFNSNIGAKLNYHFLYQRNNSISVKNLKNIQKAHEKIDQQRDKEIKLIDDGKTVKAIDYQISKLIIELEKNQANILNDENIKLKIDSYKLNIKILEQEIAQNYDHIEKLPNDDEEKTFKTDSLNNIINQKKLKIIEINKKIKEEEELSNEKKFQLEFKNEDIQKKIDSLKKSKLNYDSSFEKRLIYDKYRKKTKELNNKYEVTGIEMSWFSISYEVNSNSFKRIDPELEFANQITKEEFVSHGLGLQFSWLKLDTSESFKSFLWSNGLNFSYSDNFSDLTKEEITETNEIGETSNQRSITDKFNAYSGEYLEHNRSLNLFSDFYYFLFHQNQAALHLNPVYRVIEDTKPRFNFGVGLVFTIKNSKKEDSTPFVNAEVYYNFLDLFKTTETDYKLFERNDIGLRFTFPINFNI